MITWYSMDRNLSLVDHEAVNIGRAMEIIEGYFSRLRPKYDSAEEAIAETMFGFKKSNSEFVEICINGANAVSFRYQVTESQKILFLSVPRVFQKELTLSSQEETRAKVDAFFGFDAAAFKMEVKR